MKSSPRLWSCVLPMASTQPWSTPPGYIWNCLMHGGLLMRMWVNRQYVCLWIISYFFQGWSLEMLNRIWKALLLRCQLSVKFFQDNEMAGASQGMRKILPNGKVSGRFIPSFPQQPWQSFNYKQLRLNRAPVVTPSVVLIAVSPGHLGTRLFPSHTCRWHTRRL